MTRIYEQYLNAMSVINQKNQGNVINLKIFPYTNNRRRMKK